MAKFFQIPPNISIANLELQNWLSVTSMNWSEKLEACSSQDLTQRLKYFLSYFCWIQWMVGSKKEQKVHHNLQTCYQQMYESQKYIELKKNPNKPIKRINTTTKKTLQNPAEGKKPNPQPKKKTQNKKPPYTLMARSKSIWIYSEHVTALNVSKILYLDQTPQNLL